MISFARLSLLVSLLVLGFGCATRRESAGSSPADSMDPAFPVLGVVHASSVGPPPPYPALKTMLREQAARQFGVPVDEIVVGSIDIEGGEAIVSAPDYSTTGLMTVEVPTGGRGPSTWSASATVQRRVPKPE